MRASAAIFDEIGFVGSDEKIARRNGDGAFRRNARGQKLDQFRCAARILVDRSERRALGKNEEVLLAIEGCRLQTFRLDALGLGALFRIVADAGGSVLKGGTGFIKKLAS